MDRCLPRLRGDEKFERVECCQEQPRDQTLVFREPYLRLSAFICGWIVLFLCIRGFNLGGCKSTDGSYAEARVTRLAVYPVKGLGGQRQERNGGGVWVALRA